MEEIKARPVHWFERVRVVLFLVAYSAFAEYSSPIPFVSSRFGKVVYVLILFFLAKELVRYRTERKARFNQRVQRWSGRWERRKSRFSDFTKYRIARLVRFSFWAYALGWLIDGATDRCTGAVSCAMLAPKLLTENLPDLIQFVLRLGLSMSGIFLMMWIMARMDLFDIILPESIKLKFSDVYGQDKAVERVMENLDMLENPDEIEAKGGYMPGGILLYGPPGTGKSMLAEAAAGATGKPFVNVPPGFSSAMFVGVPIMKVKMLFRQLRKLSLKYGGVVVFLDEIDSMGSRGNLGSETLCEVHTAQETNPTGCGGTTGPRGCCASASSRSEGKLQTRLLDKIIIGGGGAGSGALQTLLSEMSGVTKPRGMYNKLRKLLGFKPIPPPKYRILMLAATNMPEALDEALLRPGRFDRKIKVGFPDQTGRAATFRGYLNKVKHDLTDEQITTLAKNNPRATGASIKDAVNEALIRAMRDNREVVTWNDVRDSIIWKGMGEDDGRQPYEEDQWRVALHESAHAVAAHHFRKSSKIQFASVVRRGQTLGVVSSIPLEERFTSLKSEMRANIKVSLASVWAEKTWFEDDISTGPASDLRTATTIAAGMFGKFAMGNNLVVLPEAKILEDYPRSVADILEAEYDELSEFLWARRDQVELVAHMLDADGTVDGEDIHALIERMEA